MSPDPVCLGSCRYMWSCPPFFGPACIFASHLLATRVLAQMPGVPHSQLALLGVTSAGLGSQLAWLVQQFLRGVPTSESVVDVCAAAATAALAASQEDLEFCSNSSLPVPLVSLDLDLGVIRVGGQSASIFLLTIAFLFGLSFWFVLDVLHLARAEWASFVSYRLSRRRLVRLSAAPRPAALWSPGHNGLSSTSGSPRRSP